MRGFPGFVNQKAGGAAPAMLPKGPVLAAPSLPQMPVPARPAVNVPAPPVVTVMVVPVLRPVTVATVTRNLQAALGPEAPPPAPTTRGFPGFISRNFNQVSQHQPGASNSNHLSGLANLFNQGPAATERRQARPAPVRPAAPVLAKPAAPAVPPAPARPAATVPVAVKKPEQAKAPAPNPSAELPRPAVAVQASAPQPKAAPPQPQPLAAARTPELPKLDLPKPAAPPVALLRGAQLGQGKAKVQSTAPAPSPSNSSGLKPAAQAPEVEAKAPAPESKPGARQTELTKPVADTSPADRLESPSTVARASAPAQVPQAAPVKANLEKLAQVRPENSEVKVGELQRQQVNSLQAPVSREQLALAQQSGAGLSAGGGSGQGGGGGQQGRQRRRQEGEEGMEEIGSAESLGGDDQVQWWHLRGEENLRVLSSELREAMFLLRTPQRPLGVEPKQVRIQKTARRQQLVEQPQVQVREEEQRQVSGDQVQLEAAELCKSCGHDLGGVDPRRCPACLRQTALATLAWLEADGRFLAYRVFLTLCRQPVASRAVYHLRDFSSLPSGAYCVQAA